MIPRQNRKYILMENVNQNDVLNTEFITFESIETFDSLCMLITTTWNYCGTKIMTLEQHLTHVFIGIIILSGPTSNVVHFGTSQHFVFPDFHNFYK